MVIPIIIFVILEKAQKLKENTDPNNKYNIKYMKDLGFSHSQA